MRPRLACEEMRRFDPSVGSPSNNYDTSRSPLITINLDRYNSLDGPPRLSFI